MSGLRTIALDVTLDGRQADSETICTWAGPYVLVIATVLPEAGLAFEVHSTSSVTRACRPVQPTSRWDPLGTTR